MDLWEKICQALLKQFFDVPAMDSSPPNLKQKKFSLARIRLQSIVKNKLSEYYRKAIKYEDEQTVFDYSLKEGHLLDTIVLHKSKESDREIIELLYDKWYRSSIFAPLLTQYTTFLIGTYLWHVHAFYRITYEETQEEYLIRIYAKNIQRIGFDRLE